MTALRHLVHQLQGRRIGIVGDVMLDHFVVGRVDRISPEAPVPVVRFSHEEYRLGGAANVANNIATLGGTARLLGLVGDDEGGRHLARELRALGLSDDDLVTDPDRPTTRKTRVVTTRNQQVARIDREEDSEPSDRSREALRSGLVAMADSVEALVLSDYRKGVVSPDIITAAVAAAEPRRVPVLVDPKVPDATRYRGVRLLTPNHHEAELMTRMTIRSDEDASLAARAIHDATGASVIVTRGEHGLFLLDASRPAVEEAVLPAVAREVADVTGAGDTVIAVLALALAAGLPLVDGARLANAAAGLVVGRFGPAAVHPDELERAIPPD